MAVVREENATVNGKRLLLGLLSLVALALSSGCVPTPSSKEAGPSAGGPDCSALVWGGDGHCHDSPGLG